MAVDTSRILTTREAAHIAQVSEDTIQDACRRGELRHGRVGRRAYRISEAALREWIFGSGADQ